MSGLTARLAARRAGGWLRSIKRSLGYYRLRATLERPRFVRALRPTDVFLVGHPKSGNTWLAYLLAMVVEPVDPDRVDLVNVGRYLPFVHGREHRIADYGGLADPRIFRNEYPRFWSSYPKVIYLYRDPRAVVVSLWEMYRTMLGDRRLPLDRFVDQYLAGNGVFRHWNSNLERWDRQVGRALDAAAGGGHLLLARYEDLVADRAAVLAEVSRFAGLDPSPERLADAVARGDFDAMRSLEDRGGAEAYRGRARGSGRFVRVGRVDGWRDELPPDLAARLVETLGPVMLRAGYPLD
ncbi:MAG: sulfotransferase domain-containing protein [Gemmatimonadales bacterium]